MSLYLYAIRSLSVDRISHYYLEAGHTQNEGDSMHAVIERAAKRVNVFTPITTYSGNNSNTLSPTFNFRSLAFLL